MPLRVGGQMVGIAFFWPEQRQTILPDLKLIELWGNALSDRIFDWRKNELKKLRQKTLKIMGQVESLLAAHDSLDLLFPKLGGLLKPLLDYQVCALVTVDRACQNLERYTLGPAGNLLWEKGVSCPAGKSLVEKVCRSGKILIENGADRPSTSKENTLPLLAACRSVLAVPLKSGQRVWGVVLFGHRELNQYRKIEGKLLGLILHQLTFHLRLRELQDEVSKRDRLLHILEQLDSQISKTSDQSERLKNISEVLSRALPVTACRISILSRGGASLEPLSEFSLREKEKFVFSSEPISLEKLPWHRLALLSKKAMLVNQSDPESMMPQEEIRTAFSRPINSALLVPLVWGEKTVGLLSLAEEREWNRRPLTYPEILTAELAADRLVNLLNISPMEGTPKQSQEELQRFWQASSAQLRRQLSDPLSGILGASELILTKGEGLDSDSQRYARIIHRMAERIKDWVTHESETPLAS